MVRWPRSCRAPSLPDHAWSCRVSSRGMPAIVRMTREARVGRGALYKAAGGHPLGWDLLCLAVSLRFSFSLHGDRKGCHVAFSLLIMIRRFVYMGYRVEIIRLLEIANSSPPAVAHSGVEGECG